MNKILRKYQKFFINIALVSYTTVLIILSTQPQFTSKKLAYLDKLQHFGAYAILTFILYFAMKFQNRFWLLKEHPASFAFVFTFSIGFLLEFNQILLPARTFNKYDLLANVLGSTLMILIIKFSVKIFKVIKESI